MTKIESDKLEINSPVAMLLSVSTASSSDSLPRALRRLRLKLRRVTGLGIDPPTEGIYKDQRGFLFYNIHVTMLALQH